MDIEIWSTSALRFALMFQLRKVDACKDFCKVMSELHLVTDQVCVETESLTRL